jgi:ubiquinone/menaquinone biosynthesis C-methylase UbiE
MSHGHAILQSHKLGATDRAHVAALLDYFEPPHGARVLDAGCGVGTVASLMAEMRPDMRFTLLNISGAQLAMAPDSMAKVRADFHDMPFADGSFDAAMFNFSLGHGLLDRCMAEAARVLRPGGVLFIYDLATNDQDYLIENVGYRPHSADEMLEAAMRHWFVSGDMLKPEASTAEFVALFGQEAFEAHGFDRTWPMIYRFVK